MTETDVGVCPRCSTPIPGIHPYRWCVNCGGRLPDVITSRLPALSTLEAPAARQQEEPRTNVPIQCPQCKGANVRVQKKETAGRIVGGIIGFAFVVFGCFADVGGTFKNPNVAILVRIGIIFMGSWAVWDAVTCLPLPRTGIRLIGTPRETHAVCAGCGHKWKLEEQGTRAAK
jgi:hypothetical protein